MAKTTDDGFVKDPKDPAFKEGWSGRLSPDSKKNLKGKSQQQKEAQSPKE